MKRIGVMLVLFTLISLSWSQETAEDKPVIDKNSWGLGFGIPYGVLGGNVDVNIAPNLNVSFGLGTTILAGVGYNFGLKYFFSSVENTMRPRIMAFYGVNAMSEIGNDTDTYTGLSLGGGIQWMWGETKSNGLDIDVIFIATTGYDIDELQDRYGTRYIIEEYGKVKFSIGYRHSF